MRTNEIITIQEYEELMKKIKSTSNEKYSKNEPYSFPSVWEFCRGGGDYECTTTTIALI